MEYYVNLYESNSCGEAIAKQPATLDGNGTVRDLSDAPPSGEVAENGWFPIGSKFSSVNGNVVPVPFEFSYNCDTSLVVFM